LKGKKVRKKLEGVLDIVSKVTNTNKYHTMSKQIGVLPIHSNTRRKENKERKTWLQMPIQKLLIHLKMNALALNDGFFLTLISFFSQKIPISLFLSPLLFLLSLARSF